MGELRVAPEPFDSQVAAALLAAAQADLAMRYGGGDATPIEATEFMPPAGGFIVAWMDDEPVGCGGWRALREDPALAEIKRMYTVPGWRGQGVASAVLAAIEDSARRAGKRSAVLETGLRQPEAIALYERQGYARIPNFGHYRDSVLCVSYARQLQR